MSQKSCTVDRSVSLTDRAGPNSFCYLWLAVVSAHCIMKQVCWNTARRGYLHFSTKGHSLMSLSVADYDHFYADYMSSCMTTYTGSVWQIE